LGGPPVVALPMIFKISFRFIPRVINLKMRNTRVIHHRTKVLCFFFVFYGKFQRTF